MGNGNHRQTGALLSISPDDGKRGGACSGAGTGGAALNLVKTEKGGVQLLHCRWGREGERDQTLKGEGCLAAFDQILEQLKVMLEGGGGAAKKKDLMEHQEKTVSSYWGV